jgi:exodeoxyribonuclease V alpha subunit
LAWIFVPSSATVEFVRVAGAWTNDRSRRQQFRASFPKVIPPTTLEGIEKYLGSGMIRGISETYAKRLVKAFGEAVFEVIEQEPDQGAASFPNGPAPCILGRP